MSTAVGLELNYDFMTIENFALEPTLFDNIVETFVGLVVVVLNKGMVIDFIISVKNSILTQVFMPSLWLTLERK